MAIVTLTDVHKSFGSEVVLDKLSLQVFPGEKVGMVGANGSGKSTIVRLIVGEIKADMGGVFRQKGLRIGYLPQEPHFAGERTVIEEMRSGFEHLFRLQERIHRSAAEMESLKGELLAGKMKEYDMLLDQFEAGGGYEYQMRIRTTLAGVGLEEEVCDTKVSALSGGQLSRLGLAKLLIMDTDLLLLDEPTNHLDLQATGWLEKFLAGFDGAVVLISHDRFLLDKIAGKIIEIEKGCAKVWSGNYSNYIRSKEVLGLERQRQYEQRKEFVERTLDFIARNKDQEGMRKTARGRKRRLRRLLKEDPDFLERPADEKTISFGFGEGRGKSELVLRCEGLGKSFGQLRLFEGISFDVLRGERLGITGPNGTGKSTFLKLAMGQVEQSEGTIRMGENLKIGYLDQRGEVLDAEKTVIEEVQSSAPQFLQEQLRGRLGAFLFSGEDVFKKTSELSGGQQSRLILCKLVLSNPDVLVLDEPTNHLDIASRQMLEEALEEYDGTVIVVSHDRFFLDRIVDKLFVVGVDRLGRRCTGGYEFVTGEQVYTKYAGQVEQRVRQYQQEKAGQFKTAGHRSGDTRQKVRRRAPEEIKRFNKYTVEQIEGMIIGLEKEIAEMKERFGDSEVYKNPQFLMQLQKEYDLKNAEVGLLYKAYEWKAEL
jgi:ATP-binding cassette, subfamily F, member 3